VTRAYPTRGVNYFLMIVALLTLGAYGARADFIDNGDFEAVDSRIGATNSMALNNLYWWTEWWDTYTSLPSETGVGDSWTEGTLANRIEVQRRAGHGLVVELDTHGATGASEMFCCYNSSMQQTFEIGPDDPNVFWLAFDYRSRLSEWQDAFNTSDVPDPGQGLTTFAVGVYLDGQQVMVVDKPTQEAWQTQMSSEIQLTAGMHTLEFRALGAADSYGGLLDNISLIAIPEPASFALVGAGLIGFFLLRRRQSA